MERCPVGTAHRIGILVRSVGMYGESLSGYGGAKQLKQVVDRWIS